MAKCLIGLGSNLGDRAENLFRSLNLLRANEQITVERVSSFRGTQPAGGPAGQGEFLNAAAVLETSLAPLALLHALQEVENGLGRVRSVHWGERTVDLDLLLYDDLELKSPELELPHPRLCFRRFVLEPAAEIAGEMVYPINGWTIAELLENINRPERLIAVHGLEFLPRDFEVLARIEAAKPCHVLRTGDWQSPNFEWRWFDTEPSESSDIPWQDWLGRDGERIIKGEWPWRGNWTIADFWFEALPVEVIGTDCSHALVEFERLNRLAVQPMLVVSIEKSPAARAASRVAFEQEMSPGGDHDPSLDAWIQWYQTPIDRLEALIHSRTTGPVLRLPADEPERVVAEVLAAMQAME